MTCLSAKLFLGDLNLRWRQIQIHFPLRILLHDGRWWRRCIDHFVKIFDAEPLGAHDASVASRARWCALALVLIGSQQTLSSHLSHSFDLRIIGTVYHDAKWHFSSTIGNPVHKLVLVCLGHRHNRAFEWLFLGRRQVVHLLIHLQVRYVNYILVVFVVTNRRIGELDDSVTLLYGCHVAAFFAGVRGVLGWDLTRYKG